MRSFLFFLVYSSSEACSSGDSERIQALESRLDQLELEVEHFSRAIDCDEGESVCSCPAGEEAAPGWLTQKCISPSDQCSTSVWDSWRLPLNVSPLHYQLEFDFGGGLEEADMVNGRFVYHGTASIRARVNEKSCEIVLHANFDTVVVKSVHVKINNENVRLALFDQNKEKQMLRITPNYPLPAGVEVDLDLSFMVNVPTNLESLDGLYSSYFDDENQSRKYLLTTQFEAWGARMAFPCFDEPSIKATFDVKMTYKHYDDSYTALFNTAVMESEETAPGLRTDTFHTTMHISPYLLAIIVSVSLSVARSKLKLTRSATDKSDWQVTRWCRSQHYWPSKVAR